MLCIDASTTVFDDFCARNEGEAFESIVIDGDHVVAVQTYGAYFDVVVCLKVVESDVVVALAVLDVDHGLVAWNLVVNLLGHDVDLRETVGEALRAFRIDVGDQVRGF